MKKGMLLLLLVIIGLPVWTGCRSRKEEFDLSRFSFQTAWLLPATKPVAPLWILDESSLRVVTFGEGPAVTSLHFDFERAVRDGVAFHAFRVTRQGAVLLHSERAIHVLVRDGRTPEAWKTARAGLTIGAFELYRDHVIVAAEGCLIVLDPRFRELARIRLGLGENKNAHDILIHGDEALLLDNVYEPIYLFRVDLKEPARPALLDAFEYSNTYPHLMFQWASVADQTWRVMSSSSDRTGTGHDMLVMDLRKPAAPRVAAASDATTPPKSLVKDDSIKFTSQLYQEVRGYARSYYTPPKEEPPLPAGALRRSAFRCGSRTPSPWVLASDDAGLHLGTYEIRDRKVHFISRKRLVDAPIPPPEPETTAPPIRNPWDVRCEFDVDGPVAAVALEGEILLLDVSAEVRITARIPLPGLRARSILFARDPEAVPLPAAGAGPSAGP